jgi:hypothetical protein
MYDGEFPNILDKRSKRSTALHLERTRFKMSLEKLYDPENALFIAYTALVLLALIPIYAGSFSSVKKVCSSKDSEDESSEIVSFEDAKMFPVYGSAALLSLYLVCM